MFIIMSDQFIHKILAYDLVAVNIQVTRVK